MRQLLLALLSLAYGSAAFAAEAAHGATEGKEQLPQFDVSTFPSQTFWLFVTFAVIYTGVKTLVMPQIGGTLDTREAHVMDALQTAGTLNEKARNLQSDYETRMAAARQDASQKLGAAREAIAKSFADGEAQQRESFNAERSAFQTRFASGKADLMKTLGVEAERLASDAAAKILSGDAAAKKRAA